MVTVPLMHALVEAGADLIELGVPFSDPMADGPVIQRASERALARGMTLRRVLAMVAEFRRDDGDTPVVLMGYLNPFEVAGYEEFAKADLVLTIRSALLGDDVVLASDEKAAARASTDHAVYLLKEIGQLYASGSLDVVALKTLHRLKKGFRSARLRDVSGYPDDSR